MEEQMSPEQLASDYLEFLCKHLEYHLKQKLGASIMRTTPFELYLTVPAIWSELAKEKTLSACQGTGLNISASGIHLVSEPVSD
jgi:molecular chaperone DnaK (HSP70)